MPPEEATFGKTAVATPAPEPVYDSRLDTLAHITLVRHLLLSAVMELVQRSHMHDWSKLEEPELSAFNEWTPKLRDVEYGSEEYEECRAGMADALTSHYMHNDHHPEHFPNGIADMNLIQFFEMVCDWVAASRRHAHGDVRKSVEFNAERFGYGDEIKQLIMNTIDWLEVRMPLGEQQEEVRG